jgi:hypothetical protein
MAGTHTLTAPESLRRILIFLEFATRGSGGCTVGELNDLGNPTERELELESIKITTRFSVRIARDHREYERSVVPSAELLQKLGEMGTDVFTFVERRWCYEIRNPKNSWVKVDDNVALLHLRSYDEWWKNIGKKTRNMIRKAGKKRIRTNVAEPNEKLAEGIWRIYNEAPIRQERHFQLFGTTSHQVKTTLRSARNCTYIGAYFQDELAGFIRLVQGDNITIISQILSLKKHWNKAVNNALIAKAIEVCASKCVKWMMYGRMGDFSHSSLDNFKQSNGFSRFKLTRYYIPLTRKGTLAIKLGLREEIADMLPPSIKYGLIPIYNWFSRNGISVYLRHSLMNNSAPGHC